MIINFLFHNKNKKGRFLFIIILTLIMSYIWKYNLYLRKLVLSLSFDKEYYLNTYPDVKGKDAINHYLKKGFFEERNPNKLFEVINHSICRIKCTIRAKEVKNLQNPKYYITIAAIFRNEARFLKEWIEFHKLIGVEHFYLFNHLSTDNYLEILEPYIKSGIVELQDITRDPSSLNEWNLIQTSVYHTIAQQVQNEVEWIAFIDLDEFLYPVKEQNLKDLLQKYDSYASLSVNWKIFGTNNIPKIPRDKLLIETLLKSSLDKDLHVKTIVKPRYVKKFLNPHFATLKKGYCQVTENFQYFMGSFAPTLTFREIRINHYWSRDLEFFNNTKLKRKHLADIELNLLLQSDQNFSKHHDDSILRFLKPLRKAIFHSSNFY